MKFPGGMKMFILQSFPDRTKFSQFIAYGMTLK